MTPPDQGEGFQTTIWQDIEMRLPRSWEMIRFGLRHRGGTCVFADEYGERLHLSWQRDADMPSVERVLSDMRAHEIARHASGGDASLQFSPLRPDHDWRGWLIGAAGERWARAVRCLPNQRTLLEATLLALGPEETPEGLLAGIHVRPPGPVRPWRAFGIAAELPSALPLSACRCLPGDAELRFEAPRSRSRVTLRRMAFPSLWLQGPLDAWLSSRLPRLSRVIRSETARTSAGHELARLFSRHPPTPWSRFLNRWVVRADLACICDAEKHAYHASVEIGEQEADLSLRLDCRCGLLAAGSFPGLADRRGGP